MPLEVLLRRTLFSPLPLKATGVTHGSFATIPAGAVAYESGRVDAIPDLHIIPGFLIPTGTIFSNCGDLIKLARAVYEGSVLSQASLLTLSTVRYPPEDYALGGRVKYVELGGVRKELAFEVGSIGGFKAVLVHIISDDVTVAILNNTNMSEDDLTALSDYLLLGLYSESKASDRL